jgi:hypothetical protein
MHKCITTWIDSSLPDLFTSSWSSSHIDLCHFKISVLGLLQWRHQTLSSFGFPTYPHTSWMCFHLSMWPKSNNIAVFALDQKCTYEGEYAIFGLLSLGYLAQNDVLQFHPFTWEMEQEFLFPHVLAKTYCCWWNIQFNLDNWVFYFLQHFKLTHDNFTNTWNVMEVSIHVDFV